MPGTSGAPVASVAGVSMPVTSGEFSAAVDSERFSGKDGFGGPTISSAPSVAAGSDPFSFIGKFREPAVSESFSVAAGPDLLPEIDLFARLDGFSSTTFFPDAVDWVVVLNGDESMEVEAPGVVGKSVMDEPL